MTPDVRMAAVAVGVLLVLLPLVLELARAWHAQALAERAEAELAEAVLGLQETAEALATGDPMVMDAAERAARDARLAARA